jgi:hypothetical protein
VQAALETALGRTRAFFQCPPSPAGVIPAASRPSARFRGAYLLLSTP